MKAKTRVFSSIAVAIVMAGVTASLLLSGYVRAAIWMEGPYFPLTLLLPGSVDTLSTMAIVVAVYYFVASLVALKHSSRWAVVLVVLSVIALNTLGLLAWHRQAQRPPGADVPIAQEQDAGGDADAGRSTEQ